MVNFAMLTLVKLKIIVAITVVKLIVIINDFDVWKFPIGECPFTAATSLALAPRAVSVWLAIVPLLAFARFAG